MLWRNLVKFAVIWALGAFEVLGAPGSEGAYVSTKVFCEEVEALLCQKGGGVCSQQDNTQHKHQCLEMVNPLVEQKAVRYQSAKARLCLLELRKGRVPPSGKSPQPSLGAQGAHIPPVCYQVLDGLIPKGASCESSVSCAGAGVCMKPAGALKGKCGQGFTKNELCDQDQSNGSFFVATLDRRQGVCAPGLSCQGDPSGVRRCR